MRNKTPNHIAEQVDRLITKKELARKLRVCERSIDLFVNRGLFKKIKLGAATRFDFEDVITSLKSQTN